MNPKLNFWLVLSVASILLVAGTAFFGARAEAEETRDQSEKFRVDVPDEEALAFGEIRTYCFNTLSKCEASQGAATCEKSGCFYDDGGVYCYDCNFAIQPETSPAGGLDTLAGGDCAALGLSLLPQTVAVGHREQLIGDDREPSSALYAGGSRWSAL